MLFNSYVFLFVFLPAALAGWYLLNHFRLFRAALFFLVAMSLWFYAYFNVSYLFLILVSILGNHALSRALHFFEGKYGGSPVPSPLLLLRRVFLAAGLLGNLGLFFYFKYFDFFLENVNALFRTQFPLQNILLPLGVSFFTFQQLSFLIDRARGDAAHPSFLSYAAFVTFFPQLIAGPIVLYDELSPQLDDPLRRRFDPSLFARGTVLFVLGLAKKVLLADVLAVPANYGFSYTYYLDTGAVLLTLLSYALELYFDFSGYCDMALGLGQMFGVKLPENFRSPYRACSAKVLWSRWHVTLTRFFTNYVYFPLGGSRRGALRTVCNILLVFALSGLWHGANWTFVLWGLLQGALVVWDSVGLIPVRPKKGEPPARTLLSRAGKKPLFTLPRPVGCAATFFLFLISLVFFRSQDVSYAAEMLRRLFVPLWPGWILRTAETLDLPELYLLTKGTDLLAPDALPYVQLAIWLALLAFSLWIVFTRERAAVLAARVPLSGRLAAGIALLFVWCVLSLSQVSTFLYFNF